MATLLNKILQATGSFIAAMNKTLWTGDWSSGSIAVPDTAKYSAFRVTLQGYDCLGFIGADGGLVVSHSVNLSSNNAQLLIYHLLWRLILSTWKSLLHITGIKIRISEYRQKGTPTSPLPAQKLLQATHIISTRRSAGISHNRQGVFA